MIRQTTKPKNPAVRYYISGIEQEPVFFNTTIRAHWGIENKLHVSMGEDASRKRKKNSPQNFSVVFKTALNDVKEI
jgi:predicted transposase YbfD/YdcC